MEYFYLVIIANNLGKKMNNSFKLDGRDTAFLFESKRIILFYVSTIHLLVYKQNYEISPRWSR